LLTHKIYPVADTGFAGPTAYAVSGGPLYEKDYKIMNTELGTKVNIYLGPLPGPWKGPMQVKCPET
jgi:hypothetical protein